MKSVFIILLLLTGAYLSAQNTIPVWKAGKDDSNTYMIVIHGGAGDIRPEYFIVALELGVRIHERTPVTGLASTGSGVRLATPAGHIVARRVVLGTNGFTPLVRSIRRYVVPVYDYVLVTEPSRRLSGTRSAGPSGRGSPIPRTISTTSAPPRTDASCGAATTRSTTSPAACGPSSNSATRRSRCWRGSSSTCSRSSKGFGSRIDGAA